jgi:hypothetical protein
MTMTGKTALEAHRLMQAVERAMKGRADKVATPDQFLSTLHDAGYDVVKLADEPAASHDGAAG